MSACRHVLVQLTSVQSRDGTGMVADAGARTAQVCAMAYPLAERCWGPHCLVNRVAAGLIIRKQSAKEHPSRSRQRGCQKQYGGCTCRAERCNAPPPLSPPLLVRISTVRSRPAAYIARCSAMVRAGTMFGDGHDTVFSGRGGGRCRREEAGRSFAAPRWPGGSSISALPRAVHEQQILIRSHKPAGLFAPRC